MNKSVPNLAKPQHSKRMLGFSSIKELARASRRPLTPLPVNVAQTPNHTLKSSNSLYGTLRDQCTPPAPIIAAPPQPVESDLHHQQSSSIESFTPDDSGFSNDSSHPTTLSIGNHPASDPLKSSSSSRALSMGNQSSSIIKNPLSIKKRFSRAKLHDEEEQKGQTSQKSSLEQGPPRAALSPRGSSRTLQVPRRRSSLTALHLDNSHFSLLDPNQPRLQNRASTLTEPGARRPSSNGDTIRPVNSGGSRITPSIEAKKREQTLSPPLLSPPSRVSSNSSQSRSVNSQSDNRRNSRIHLPKTFPLGPVPMHAPPLTDKHYTCYSGHNIIVKTRNDCHPIPCMTCKEKSPVRFYRCCFCLLRICTRCAEALEVSKKDLKGLMEWLGKIKEEEEAAKGATTGREAEKGEVDTKPNVEKEMEEQALKKIETTKKRETR